MIALKEYLINAGQTEKEAQELLNKHYLKIKPIMFNTPINELVAELLYQEITAITDKMMDDNKKKKTKGPQLWQCDPFTGMDMYGRMYTGF